MKVNVELRGKNAKIPVRKYEEDVGADVFSPITRTLYPGPNTIDLEIAVEVPKGYSICIFPRSSMTQRGIVAQVPPIDPGYTGNIHAILINTCKDCYQIKAGDRIGQLVMFPVVKPIFVQNKVENKGGRGDNGLGSSGK